MTGRLSRLKPWWFCCGWRSYWCVLDVLSGCKIQAVCDRHDHWLTREYDGGDPGFYEEDEPVDKVKAPSPRTATLLACPAGCSTITAGGYGVVLQATCTCGRAMVRQEATA